MVGRKFEIAIWGNNGNTSKIKSLYMHVCHWGVFISYTYFCELWGKNRRDIWCNRENKNKYLYLGQTRTQHTKRQIDGNFALFDTATVPGTLNDNVLYFINTITTQKLYISDHILWFLFKFKLCGFTTFQEIWPFTCLSLLPTTTFLGNDTLLVWNKMKIKTEQNNRHFSMA